MSLRKTLAELDYEVLREIGRNLDVKAKYRYLAAAVHQTRSRLELVFSCLNIYSRITDTIDASLSCFTPSLPHIIRLMLGN